MKVGDSGPMADCEPTDSAWLFYTSGTTGRPKGAVLSHRNLLAMSLNYYADVDRPLAGGSIVHAAPISHGSGLWNFPMLARGSVQVFPESGHYDVAETVTLMNRWPDCSIFLAPTMVKRLIEHGSVSELKPGALRLITYGGAPMYVSDLKRAMETLGDKALCQLYGQGESPMTITHLSREVHADKTHPRWEQRLASAGVADTCVEVRVVDETGKKVPTGEVGEIVVKGDTVMSGYWNNPEATARSLRDGWLWTGDVGAFDEDGFLTLKDRSKDMIISGGSNIYPREIEDVLNPVWPNARWSAGRIRSGARRSWRSSSRGPAPRRVQPNSTSSAWTTSHASSGRKTTSSSTPCRRTITARSSRPSCAPNCRTAKCHP
jgi:acyl-CoA synthetase (AMP-forming)/AMP-acid ligase II